MSLLLNPNVFNYVILTLFMANAIRWTTAGNNFQGLYWVGALLIQFAVTFLMEHK